MSLNCNKKSSFNIAHVLKYNGVKIETSAILYQSIRLSRENGNSLFWGLDERHVIATYIYNLPYFLAQIDTDDVLCSLPYYKTLTSGSGGSALLASFIACTCCMSRSQQILSSDFFCLTPEWSTLCSVVDKTNWILISRYVHRIVIFNL